MERHNACPIIAGASTEIFVVSLLDRVSEQFLDGLRESRESSGGEFVTHRNLDIRLIRALQTDARRSNRQLAEELGVAASTVGHRLKDLEERGVIRGYRPLIDYRALGLGLVAITRIKARGEALPNIIRSLIEHPHLTHVYEITGEFDVMVIGRFADESQMNREIKSMLGLPGIEGTNTSVVLDTPKEQLDVELALG